MSAKPITENTLFYGDNLKVLREYIPDESVDLIYLDPRSIPIATITFYSKMKAVSDSEAQIMLLQIPGTGMKPPKTLTMNYVKKALPMWGR